GAARLIAPRTAATVQGDGRGGRFARGPAGRDRLRCDASPVPGSSRGRTSMRYVRIRSSARRAGLLAAALVALVALGVTPAAATGTPAADRAGASSRVTSVTV